MRKTFTGTTSRGGCFMCHGSAPAWHGANAMAVAAKHHDATGHPTWAEQHLSVRYGERDDPDQMNMFEGQGNGE